MIDGTGLSSFTRRRSTTGICRRRESPKRGRRCPVLNRRLGSSTLYFLYGGVIFPLSLLLLENGEPHPDDFPCQMVGLTIDSNSGRVVRIATAGAAVVFALTMPGLARGSMEGARVVSLDWVFRAWRGRAGAVASARARNGAECPRRSRRRTATAYIEPAGNGYAVIEAARVQGLNPREIDSKYVTAGKDARALMVEPHAAGGRVKIGRTALDKRTSYRGMTTIDPTGRSRVRAFDKEAYRREDDLGRRSLFSAGSSGDGTERAGRS